MKTRRTNTKMMLSFVCLLFVLASCEGLKEIVKKTPKDLISLNQAREAAQSYSIHRIKIINQYEDSIRPEGEPFIATRFGSKTNAELNEYFTYTRALALLSGVDSLGYQFYLTNYPDSTHYKTGEVIKHPKKNSLCIVPTLRKDGKEYGFQVVLSKDGVFRPVLIKDFIAAEAVGDTLDLEGGTLYETISNDLNSKPPPKPDGNGGMGDIPGGGI